MVRLLEYQGKALLKSVAVLVPKGEVATTAQEAKAIAGRLGKAVMVKAQVPVTGRYKEGGIGSADTPAEAEDVAGRILTSKIKGFAVRKILVEEKLDAISQFYAGIIVDDSCKVKAPVLMFATEGGVDVEQVAAEHPERVRRAAIDLLAQLSLDEIKKEVASLAISSALTDRLGQIVFGVYKIFREYDARSVEVNPIVVTSGGMAYAADCRIVLDEAAVMRHPEFGIDFPREIGRAPTDLEKRAWKIEEKDFRGIAYFIQMATEINPGEGYVGFHGIGGGGAMIGADALIRHGLKLANYADTSGNPTASKVYRIIKTIFSQPNIDGYVLMGPVIANQEQWHHAHALVRALREELTGRPNFPVVILIAGNKEHESIEIIKQGLSGLPARVEIFGRDYVYNVDYVAQRMKTLVTEYNALERRNIGG